MALLMTFAVRLSEAPWKTIHVFNDVLVIWTGLRFDVVLVGAICAIGLFFLARLLVDSSQYTFGNHMV